MITETIVGVFLGLAHIIAFIIPNLPESPAVFTETWQALVEMVAGSLSVVGMLFSPPLVVAVAFVTITMISWTTIYGSVKFIWAKIPFLNNIKL